MKSSKLLQKISKTYLGISFNLLLALGAIACGPTKPEHKSSSSSSSSNTPYIFLSKNTLSGSHDRSHLRITTGDHAIADLNIRLTLTNPADGGAQLGTHSYYPGAGDGVIYNGLLSEFLAEHPDLTEAHGELITLSPRRGTVNEVGLTIQLINNTSQVVVAESSLEWRREVIPTPGSVCVIL